MSLPRGRSLKLSRGRRLVADIMRFSRSVPQVSVERVAQIPEVVIAREAASPKPGWYPVLLKGFALASTVVPELRRSLITVPYPRLYEHACTVASVTIEREIDGEPIVLAFHVREPERKPLLDIDARFRWMKTAPLNEVGEFRRMLLLSRFPRPLRRLLWWLGLRASGSWRQKYWGTFATSSTVSGGSTLLSPLCPLTTVFTFGPVQNDGSVLLRLGFDHRVLDGMTAARGLKETENALRTTILDELRSLARPVRLAV
jgi:hypothetical protein